MPSQLVLLPPHILRALADALNSRGPAVPSSPWRLSVVESDGEPVIGMVLDPLLLCPARRPAFQDHLLTLVLASRRDASTLPRPLPRDLTLYLLRELETCLPDLDGLSGHERVAISAALGNAAGAANTPGIAIPARTPSNPFEADLVIRGRHYRQMLAPARPSLERRLDRFRRRLHASGVETAMARLDAQAEIGAALAISSGAGGSLVATLSYRTRRGELPALICATQNQLLASVQATLMAEPNLLGARIPIGVDELQSLHISLMRGLLPDKALGRWRSGDITIRSPLRGHATARGAPGALLECHMAELLAAFDLGLWTDVDPLVRAGMFHMRFQKAHPFRDGNGRVGRMALSCMLAESGWPLLPVNIVLHWRRRAYLDAVSRAAAADDDLPLLHFLLKAVDEAITLGHRMLNLLRAERWRLLKVLGALGHGTRDSIRITDMLLSTLVAPNFGIWLSHQEVVDAFDELVAMDGLLKLHIDGRLGYALPSLLFLMNQPLPDRVRRCSHR